MMLSVVVSVHWPMSLCTNLFLNRYFVMELCSTIGLRRGGPMLGPVGV
jgi:hypothetical protein